MSKVVININRESPSIDIWCSCHYFQKL